MEEIRGQFIVTGVIPRSRVVPLELFFRQDPLSSLFLQVTSSDFV